MGTQKNRLNETVLLSTQNMCLNSWVRKYLQFYAQQFCLSKPMVHGATLTTTPKSTSQAAPKRTFACITSHRIWKATGNYVIFMAWFVCHYVAIISELLANGSPLRWTSIL